MMPLTSDEVKHIASEAAKEAVSELLLTMGVDVKAPNAFTEMQKDFAHVRAWRQSVETVKTRGLTAAIGVIVAGLMGAVWMAMPFKGH